MGYCAVSPSLLVKCFRGEKSQETYLQFNYWLSTLLISSGYQWSVERRGKTVQIFPQTLLSFSIPDKPEPAYFSSLESTREAGYMKMKRRVTDTIPTKDEENFTYQIRTGTGIGYSELDRRAELDVHARSRDELTKQQDPVPTRQGKHEWKKRLHQKNKVNQVSFPKRPV